MWFTVTPRTFPARIARRLRQTQTVTARKAALHHPRASSFATACSQWRPTKNQGRIGLPVQRQRAWPGCFDLTPTATTAVASILGDAGVQLLRRFLLVMLVISSISAAYGLWTYGLQSAIFGTGSAFFLLGACYLLMRAGYVRTSIQLLLWGGAVVVLSLPFYVAGLRTPALFLLPTLCMFAAWLVSVRAAYGIFATSSAILIGLVAAETWLGYVPPNHVRDSTTIAIALIGSMLGCLLIALSTSKSFQSQLDEMQSLSQQQDQQMQALRLSEERFSALFRANPAPSSTLDEVGRTMEVNEAWVALFGISAQEAHNKTTQELGIWVDPDVRTRVRARITADGRISGMPVDLNTASGQRHFLIYVSPVETTGRQCLVSVLVDQTDRLAVEAVQKQENAQLEARVTQRTAELSQALETLRSAQSELVQSEKLASLGAMVAGISHELNTPIGNTLTVASTLHDRVAELRQAAEKGQLRRSTLNDFLAQLEDMSGLIARSSGRAADLIESFKQVAVDRTTERRRVFGLRELCHDIVASLKAGMRKAQVDISLDIPDSLQCDGYPGPLGQILTNLVQNAIVHAFGERTDGRIAIAATVDASSPSPTVVLTVTDDGVGMSEYTRSRAFDPFFTTRMGQGGSGLGLSISHRLATTTLQGSLTIASTPGAGCCFTLRMPQRAAGTKV